MFNGVSLVCLCKSSERFMSSNVLFVMKRVALFCILCSFRLFVVLICIAGYSRIGRISVVYKCFLILVGACLNLYSLEMLFFALFVMVEMCSEYDLLKLRWNPKSFTCDVVCTGVLFICMSFIISSSSMYIGFVAILHLLGLTVIFHFLSQSSMFCNSCLRLFLACVTFCLRLLYDRVTVIMSSANCVLTVSMYMGGGKSFTNMLNNIGPMTDP